MSTVIPIEEVQARLAEIIEQLRPGDEIVITKNDRPVAKLHPLAQQKSSDPYPRFGSCKGMLEIVKEDDEHLEDFKEYM